MAHPTNPFTAPLARPTTVRNRSDSLEALKTVATGKPTTFIDAAAKALVQQMKIMGVQPLYGLQRSEHLPVAKAWVRASTARTSWTITPTLLIVMHDGEKIEKSLSEAKQTDFRVIL